MKLLTGSTRFDPEELILNLFPYMFFSIRSYIFYIIMWMEYWPVIKRDNYGSFCAENAGRSFFHA